MNIELSERETVPAELCPLTDAERARLAELTDQANAGLAAFCEAVEEIRDRKLYRESAPTFEEYCRAHLGVGAHRARQLLRAGEVLRNISDAEGAAPLALPAIESQIRPLVALPPELQRKAWAEAVATAPGGRVTAAHVQAVVDRTLGKAAAGDLPRKGARNHKKTDRVFDGGSKRDRVRAALEKAIAEVRFLLDETGTADSVAATEVGGALRSLDNYKRQLESVEKMQEARP